MMVPPVTTTADGGPSSPTANVPTSPPTPIAAFISFTPEQFSQLLSKLDEVVGTRGWESSDSQPHQCHPYRYELFKLKRTTIIVILYSAEDTTRSHQVTTAAAKNRKVLYNILLF